LPLKIFQPTGHWANVGLGVGIIVGVIEGRGVGITEGLQEGVTVGDAVGGWLPAACSQAHRYSAPHILSSHHPPSLIMTQLSGIGFPSSGCSGQGMLEVQVSGQLYSPCSWTLLIPNQTFLMSSCICSRSRFASDSTQSICDRILAHCAWQTGHEISSAPTM
jgi:hypothetical protein